MSNAKYHVLLLFALLFTPIFNNFILLGVTGIGFFDYLNEVVYIFLFFIVILRWVCSKKMTYQSLYLFFIVLYFLFQIVYLKLPIGSFIQLLLYLEAPVYYLYFNELSEDNKFRTIELLSKGLKIVAYIVIAVSILEFINPKFVTSFTHLVYTNRGLFGYFYIGSIFGSSIALAHFCIISLFYHFAIKFLYDKNVFSKFVLILLSCTMFFSFSRKEMMLYIMLLFFSVYMLKYKTISFKKILIPSLVILLVIVVYTTSFFGEANDTALSDTYVRLQMLLFSYNIFLDYFPFGCGLGTFGSQMSLVNHTIYDKYNVGANIIGTSSERGPIYDLFLPTFTAELGLGLIIYILFFIFIFKKKEIVENSGIKFLKCFAVFAIFVNGIFAPVLMSSFGLIMISSLGLLTIKDNSQKLI